MISEVVLSFHSKYENVKGVSKKIYQVNVKARKVGLRKCISAHYN